MKTIETALRSYRFLLMHKHPKEIKQLACVNAALEALATPAMSVTAPSGEKLEPGSTGYYLTQMLERLQSLGHVRAGKWDYAVKLAIEALSAPSGAQPRGEAELIWAARALYYAGCWHCDRPVDEVKLWTDLKKALHLPDGTSPAPVSLPSATATEEQKS